MNDFDIATLSTGELNADGGLATVQATIPLTDATEDVEHFGNVGLYGALGVTSLPAPATSDGRAEGVVLRNVGNADGVVIAARDERAAATVGELAPGETALHSTGEGFESRVFCKDQLVAIIVGSDVVVTIDRKEQKINIAGFGHVFEMSEGQGIILQEAGGAALILKDGKAVLKGAPVLLGDGPLLDKAAPPLNAVAIGVAGPANLVATSVLAV